MSTATPKLDGNWQISGLPEGDVVVIFTMNQSDSDVVGSLVINNDKSQSFRIMGNNNYPNVALDFNVLDSKADNQLAFTFTGAFINAHTVIGSLSGEFTGPATLSRSDVK